MTASLNAMQRFIQLTEGYIYPAKTGGWIKRVALVENQEMPTLKQYLGSIPTLVMNGTTRLPKPIGADTKVLLSTAHRLFVPLADRCVQRPHCMRFCALAYPDLQTCLGASRGLVLCEGRLGMVVCECLTSGTSSCGAGVCGQLSGACPAHPGGLLFLWDGAAEPLHVVHRLRLHAGALLPRQWVRRCAVSWLQGTALQTCRETQPSDGHWY